MGDAQSAQRDGTSEEAAAEEQSAVQDGPSGDSAQDKLIQNNGQISDKNVKSVGTIREVKDHSVDKIAKDVIAVKSNVSAVAKPKVVPTVQIIEEDLSDANKEEAIEIINVETKQNDLNESFRKFFSNIGLKLTVKRGVGDKDEEGEKEVDTLEETGSQTKYEEFGQNTDLNAIQDNDSTTCPTMTDGTPEDVVETMAEAKEIVEKNSEESKDAMLNELRLNENEEELVSPIKKFFTTGIFAGLAKRKKEEEEEQVKDIFDDSKNYTTEEQLIEETTPNTNKQEELKCDNAQIEEVPAMEAPEDDIRGKCPSTDQDSEPELTSSQERVQSSPFKRLFSGSFKRRSKKQKRKKSNDAKLFDSDEHSENKILPPREASEQQEKVEVKTEPKKVEEIPPPPLSQSMEPETSTALQPPTQESEVATLLQTPATEPEEELSAWETFKKLLTPKKTSKRVSEEGEVPAETVEETKPSEGERISDSSTEEGRKRKDSTHSWEAVLCGSGRRRSRKTSDSEDEQKEEDMQMAVPNDTEDVVTSTPKQAASPSDSESSAWKSFKKLMTPKRKIKQDEDNKDNVLSDSEATHEESLFSFRRLIPGRKKKQEQLSSDEGDREALSIEEDSETPAVVPLSEFDQSEIEETAKTDATIEESKLESELEHMLEIPKTFVQEIQEHKVTPIIVLKEDQDELTEFSKYQPLSDIPEEGNITETVATSLIEEVAKDDTIAEDLVEITSEAITAPEPVDITMADETEDIMLSAASHLPESSKTSGNATPVPVEYDVKDTDVLLKEVAQTISEATKADTVCSQEPVLDKIIGNLAHETLNRPVSEQQNVLEMHKESETVTDLTRLQVDQLQDLDVEISTQARSESLSEFIDAISTEYASEISKMDFESAKAEVAQSYIAHPEQPVKQESVDDSEYMIDSLSEVPEFIDIESHDILPPDDNKTMRNEFIDPSLAEKVTVIDKEQNVKEINLDILTMEAMIHTDQLQDTNVEQLPSEILPDSKDSVSAEYAPAVSKVVFESAKGGVDIVYIVQQEQLEKQLNVVGSDHMVDSSSEVRESMELDKVQDLCQYVEIIQESEENVETNAQIDLPNELVQPKLEEQKDFKSIEDTVELGKEETQDPFQEETDVAEDQTEVKEVNGLDVVDVPKTAQENQNITVQKSEVLHENSALSSSATTEEIIEDTETVEPEQDRDENEQDQKETHICEINQDASMEDVTVTEAIVETECGEIPEDEVQTSAVHHEDSALSRLAIAQENIETVQPEQDSSANGQETDEGQICEISQEDNKKDVPVTEAIVETDGGEIPVSEVQKSEVQYEDSTLSCSAITEEIIEDTETVQPEQDISEHERDKEGQICEISQEAKKEDVPVTEEIVEREGRGIPADKVQTSAVQHEHSALGSLAITKEMIRDAEIAQPEQDNGVNKQDKEERHICEINQEANKQNAPVTEAVVEQKSSDIPVNDVQDATITLFEATEEGTVPITVEEILEQKVEEDTGEVFLNESSIELEESRIPGIVADEVEDKTEVQKQEQQLEMTGVKSEEVIPSSAKERKVSFKFDHPSEIYCEHIEDKPFTAQLIEVNHICENAEDVKVSSALHVSSINEDSGIAQELEDTTDLEKSSELFLSTSEEPIPEMIIGESEVNVEEQLKEEILCTATEVAKVEFAALPEETIASSQQVTPTIPDLLIQKTKEDSEGISEKNLIACVNNVEFQNEPKHEVRLANVQQVGVQGEKEAGIVPPATSNADVQNAFVTQMTTYTLENVASGIPYISVETTTLEYEPVVTTVANEQEQNTSIETATQFEVKNVIPVEKEGKTVFLLHASSAKLEDNHQIQVEVTDVDIQSAEKRVDTIEVVVQEDTDVLCTCHETVDKVDCISAQAKIEEEMVSESDNVVVQELIQHLKEPEEPELKVPLNDVVDDKLSESQKILERHVVEDSSSTVQDSVIEIKDEGIKDVKNELDKVENKVVNQGDTAVAVPQNTGIISNRGNVDSPSSLSLEFKLNIQFGQNKAPILPPPPPTAESSSTVSTIERNKDKKLTEITETGVQAVDIESEQENGQQKSADHVEENTKVEKSDNPPVLVDVGIQSMQPEELNERNIVPKVECPNTQTPEILPSDKEFLKKDNISDLVFLQVPKDPKKQTEDEDDNQDVWLDAEEDIDDQVKTMPISEFEESYESQIDYFQETKSDFEESFDSIKKTTQKCDSEDEDFAAALEDTHVANAISTVE